MKKLYFFILFNFYFLLAHAGTMTLNVVCIGGQDLYDIGATCGTSLGNYQWEVLKDGIIISTSITGSNSFYYQVNPASSGDGNYRLRVKRVSAGTIVTDLSNAVFLNYANPNFKINESSDANFPMCIPILTDTIITINPVSQTISSSRIRVYYTNNYGGTAGSLILNELHTSGSPYVITLPSSPLYNYYLVEFISNSNCGSKTDIKYVYLNTACKMGDFSDENSNSIEIYPNPIESVLNYNQSEEIEKVEIFNSQGHIEKSNANIDNATIDFSNFSHGMYMVRFHKKNGEIITKKVMKK